MLNLYAIQLSNALKELTNTDIKSNMYNQSPHSFGYSWTSFFLSTIFSTKNNSLLASYTRLSRLWIFIYLFILVCVQPKDLSIPSPKLLAFSPWSTILAWLSSAVLLDTRHLLDRNSLDFYAKRHLTSGTMVVFNWQNIFKLLLDLMFLNYFWPVDLQFEKFKLQNNIITQLRKKQENSLLFFFKETQI